MLLLYQFSLFLVKCHAYFADDVKSCSLLLTRALWCIDQFQVSNFEQTKTSYSPTNSHINLCSYEIWVKSLSTKLIYMYMCILKRLTLLITIIIMLYMEIKLKLLSYMLLADEFLYQFMFLWDMSWIFINWIYVFWTG
jgi:hypothetical protein